MKTEIINGHKVKIYDNGGKSLDRITAVYLDFKEWDRKLFEARAMCENTVGFCQMTSASIPNRYLGKRIAFQNLSKACQNQIKKDLTLTK